MLRPSHRAQVADADGWTLLSQALGHLGREEAARAADGFGAVLTGTTGPAPSVARGAKVTPTEAPATAVAATFSASGSSTVTVAGSVANTTLEATGGSNVDASGLTSRRLLLKVSGASLGSLLLWVS